MGTWKLALLAVLAGIVAMAVVLSCGGEGDDDDSGGGDGGWTCAQGCSIVYDDCNKSIYVDGSPVPHDECVDGCNNQGGPSDCMVVCLDNFTNDDDCEALAECLVGCE